MNSVADHRAGLPLSAACAPELIAAKMEAVLMPPSAAISTSRSREPCISRRTSWKNGIVIVRFRPGQGVERANQAEVHSAASVQNGLLAVWGPVPFDSAGWAGQQQYNQHQNRRDENRYDERSQKTDPALAAAQRRKKTENEIYDDANRYGHAAIFLPLKVSSLSLSIRVEEECARPVMPQRLMHWRWPFLWKRARLHWELWTEPEE